MAVVMGVKTIGQSVGGAGEPVRELLGRAGGITESCGRGSGQKAPNVVWRHTSVITIMKTLCDLGTVFCVNW